MSHNKLPLSPTKVFPDMLWAYPQSKPDLCTEVTQIVLSGIYWAWHEGGMFFRGFCCSFSVVPDLVIVDSCTALWKPQKPNS